MLPHSRTFSEGSVEHTLNHQLISLLQEEKLESKEQKNVLLNLSRSSGNETAQNTNLWLWVPVHIKFAIQIHGFPNSLASDARYPTHRCLRQLQKQTSIFFFFFSRLVVWSQCVRSTHARSCVVTLGLRRSSIKRIFRNVRRKAQ